MFLFLWNFRKKVLESDRFQKIWYYKIIPKDKTKLLIKFCVNKSFQENHTLTHDAGYVCEDLMLRNDS